MKKYRIFRIENYLYLVDNETNKLFSGHVKSVEVEPNNLGRAIYRIKGLRDWNHQTPLDIRQILDESGTPYTTGGWETFYTENTGNFNGGGAAPVLETQNKVIEIGLNQLAVNTFEEVTYDMLSAYVTFKNIVAEKGEDYHFKVVEFVEEEVVNYNFDITANGWATEGITNQASFVEWLETRAGNSLNNIVVTDFNFTGNRLACNITADGLSINLGGIIALNVDGIGNIIGLETISLDYNYLSYIDLSLLPQTATLVYLGSNQLNTSSYITMEASASALPNFTNTCTIFFGGNLNSINGTNLKAILESKNCIVYNS